MRSLLLLLLLLPFFVIQAASIEGGREGGSRSQGPPPKLDSSQGGNGRGGATHFRFFGPRRLTGTKPATAVATPLASDLTFSSLFAFLQGNKKSRLFRKQQIQVYKKCERESTLKFVDFFCTGIHLCTVSHTKFHLAFIPLPAHSKKCYSTTHKRSPYASTALHKFSFRVRRYSFLPRCSTLWRKS